MNQVNINQKNHRKILNFILELDPDDYERYEENPISQQYLQTGMYYRTYIGMFYSLALDSKIRIKIRRKTKISSYFISGWN